MSTTIPPRNRRSRATFSANVPFVGWSQLEAHLATTWKHGEHMTLIGKTGSGKTHLALALLDLRTYSLIMATKRRDPLLTEASRGYTVVESMREIPRTADGVPVHRRVIVWPARAIEDQESRLKAQQAALKETLAVAERQGYWTVLSDETMWLYDRLRLQRELDSVWYQGRSSGLSFVACAQRPTRVPRLMISQASHLFLSYVSDKRDLEPLRDIAGVVPPEILEAVLPTLDWERHEFLYIGADTGYIARTIAPPR